MNKCNPWPIIGTIALLSSAGCGGGGGGSSTVAGQQLTAPPASQYPAGNLSISSVSYAGTQLTINGNFPYTWPTTTYGNGSYAITLWSEKLAVWQILPARGVISHSVTQIVVDLGVTAPTYPISGYPGVFYAFAAHDKIDTFVEYNDISNQSTPFLETPPTAGDQFILPN